MGQWRARAAAERLFRNGMNKHFPELSSATES
jgi:hypothetical protein